MRAIPPHRRLRQWIGKLHDALLDALKLVARPGEHEQHEAVDHVGDRDLRLAHADGLHDHDIEARRLEAADRHRQSHHGDDGGADDGQAPAPHEKGAAAAALYSTHAGLAWRRRSAHGKVIERIAEVVKAVAEERFKGLVTME